MIHSFSTPTSHQEISDKLDAYFGALCLLLSLLTVVDVSQDQAPLTTLGWFLTFPLFNSVLSYLGKKTHRFLAVVLFRILGGAILCFFVSTRTTGPLAPYWPIFLMMPLGCGVQLFWLTQKALWSNLQTFLWLAVFAYSNHVAHFMPWNQYFVVAAVVAVATTMFLEIIQILGNSLKREADAKLHYLHSSRLSALGEMAGSLAHEINNPLAILKSISEQMNEVLDDGLADPTLFRRMTSKLIMTTERIAVTVGRLKAFTRDGSNDPMGPVKVGALVQETVSFCGERLKNYGVELHREHFNPDLTFEGRAVEISQVLFNLINNSIDAVSELNERWIKIAVHDEGRNIGIRVTDSGNGIPAANRNRLFEPFFTTKSVGKGTGLALSASFRIVQSYGGQLRLDTASPHTSFVIQLPKTANTLDKTKDSNP